MMSGERNMVPASRWHDNKNGTAWVVAADPRDLLGADERIDRQCDTCHGYIDMDDDTFECPDCIDGRHTREMTVVFGDLADEYPFRVSVVPGMVLPIVGAHETGVSAPRIIGATSRGGMDGSNPHYLFMLWVGCDGRRITLPDAAEPGMWAVLLKIEAV